MFLYYILKPLLLLFDLISAPGAVHSTSWCRKEPCVCLHASLYMKELIVRCQFKVLPKRPLLKFSVCYNVKRRSGIGYMTLKSVDLLSF